MKLDDNTFAFTAWLMRNTHVETETGLTEFDGHEWYNYMWDKWLHNSDAGRKIINDGVRNNMMNNNPGTETRIIDGDNDDRYNSKLETVTFTFTQETNCVDGPSNDIETLTIEAKSSMGIDNDEGAFYVLRTEQWSVNDANEIHETIKRCEKAIDAIVNK
jgi:hypothetical protein